MSAPKRGLRPGRDRTDPFLVVSDELLGHGVLLHDPDVLLEGEGGGSERQAGRGKVEEGCEKADGVRASELIGEVGVGAVAEMEAEDVAEGGPSCRAERISSALARQDRLCSPGDVVSDLLVASRVGVCTRDAGVLLSKYPRPKEVCPEGAQPEKGG